VKLSVVINASMNRKRIRILASAAVLFILCAACNASVGGPRAQVNCNGVGNAYDCTVTHTSGGSGQVCWDIRATCQNGAIVSANSCVELSEGGTVQHSVPVTSFSQWDTCDSVATLEIVDTGN